MDLHLFIAQQTQLVDAALERWLPKSGVEPVIVHGAMRYSVFAGGKRLRPVLAIAAGAAVDGKPEQLLPAACALELIHTYSLIHDDLPAMDDDALRRGKPTNHKVFGEATAILAGDALLTFAFELLATQSVAAGVAATIVLQVVNELATAAGTTGMIGGQILDLAAEGQQVQLEHLEHIHNLKTGALLRGSVRAGAIIGGANEAQLRDLTTYADCLGLAFQIKDDILDVEGDSAKLGKLVGSDLAKQKSTYPSLLGLAESKRMLSAQIDRALESLASFAAKGKVLADLALFVRDREF